MSKKRRSWGAVRQVPGSRRFQASYVGPDGVRHNAPWTFVNKTDADQYLAEVRSSISKGEWNPPSLGMSTRIPSLGDFAEKHIEMTSTLMGEGLRESTKFFYRRLLRTHCSGLMERQLDQISKQDIDELFAYLRSSGKYTTASKVYKLLRAIMNRAVEYGLVPSNPCSIKGANSLTSGKAIAVPSPSEVMSIADAITPKYRMLVLLAAYGGFRFGEITELRRSDVRRISTEGQVSYQFLVSRAVTYVDREFVVSKPKSRKSIRTVDVTPVLNPEIERLLNAEVAQGENSLLFPRDSKFPEEHLRHDAFAKSFKKALKSCGLSERGFSAHSLRHFAGTQFHRAGATIPELMAWLGDSSLAAVQRYLHATGDSKNIAKAMPLEGSHGNAKDPKGMPHLKIAS